jgi:zinc-ribbon domain
MQAYGETYPRTAYLLSLIGGILILVFSIIYAIILLVIASLFAAVGFGLGVGVAVGLAVVALFFGLIVLYFAFKLKTNPANARTYGILILVFAVISFIGGGGFYIGAILALIGGILAIVWTPPATTYGQPMMGQPMPGGAAWGQPPPPPPPSAAPAAAPGVAQFCQFCGTAIPAGAKFCPKCGAATPGS